MISFLRAHIYDTIGTTLETLDQVPSWSAVTERLMHEDEKKKGFEDGEKAYFSRKPNTGIICFNCGGKGHIKRNCRKKSVSYAAEKVCYVQCTPLLIYMFNLYAS